MTEPRTEQQSRYLCEPGKYVACLYYGNWLIGTICEISEEHAGKTRLGFLPLFLKEKIGVSFV